MDAQTKDGVIRAIEEIAGTSESASDPEFSLADDLGLDSLDTVELVLMLEERFCVTLPDDVDEKWRTVGDVLATMDEALTASTPQSAEA